MRTIVIFALAAAGALAADNALTPAESAEGWRLLFDGKSVQGWLDPAAKNKPGDAWMVENGTLKTRLKPKIGEDLITEESFGDFELKFDWKLSPRANTGVKYRIQRTVFLDHSKNPRKGISFEEQLGRELAQKLSDRTQWQPGQSAEEYVVGFEFQLLDDERHPDAFRDPRHVTGALYSMIAPFAKASRPAGEWNEGRLVVKGYRIEHWVNGTKVLEGTLNADAVRAGVAKRWRPAPEIREALMNPKPRGPISLQHHGDEVWFRNLKIRTH